MNLKELNIHEIIEQAVANISLQVQQRDGFIIKELNALNSNVMGEQIHLTNIIYNLLDNANKYSVENQKLK
ncbi:MAG: hypothetical protein IPO16_08920 [Saprospiraceae bacterium]|nr:hypothetical protein [Saprospiraceae bacterium]